MIPRLKGVIAHSHDTKVLGEDGEDLTIGQGTRLSPKAKPFEEDPRDTPTCGLWNRPNPKKDSTGVKVHGRYNNHLGKGENSNPLSYP